MRVTVSDLARGILLSSERARSASIAGVDRQQATAAARSTLAGRNGPTMSRPDAPPVVLDGHHAVDRAREARLRHVAGVAGILGPYPADRGRAGRAPVGQRVHVGAQLVLASLRRRAAPRRSSRCARGCRRGVTKLLQSSSSPSRSTRSSRRMRPSKTRSSRLDLGLRGANLGRHAGTVELRSRLPPTHGREQGAHVGREAELLRGHGQKSIGLDAEHLRQLVLGVELRPRQVEQAEEGLEHALPVDGGGLEHGLASAAARASRSPRRSARWAGRAC